MSQITDPPTPYLGPINSFSPGHMLRIQGLAPGNAQRFNINLQCGPNVNPRDDVALHLSVRLIEGYVARNTLDAGMWGTEQGDGALRIAPGQRFEVLLFCDANEYKIAINGQHFATFPHRIAPTRITHLAIDGDVKLGMISAEGGAPDASHQATAASEQFGHQQQPSAPPPQQGGQYGGYSGYGGPPPQGGYGGPPPQGGYGGPQGGGYGPPPPPPGHQQSIGFTMPTASGTANLHSSIYPPLPKQPSPVPYRIQAPIYPPVLPNHQYHLPNPPYPTQQGVPINPYQQPYGYPGGAPGYPAASGHPSYPGANPTPSDNSSSWTSKIPGGAAAMGAVGGMLPMMGKGGKKMKKSHMKKAMKYGIPIAGAGVGAYAISKAVGHGHHRRRGSSSSSSSSSD